MDPSLSDGGGRRKPKNVKEDDGAGRVTFVDTGEAFG
jgi:hypothetical protein